MPSNLEKVLWVLGKATQSVKADVTDFLANPADTLSNLKDHAVYCYENPAEVLSDVGNWIKENKVTCCFIVAGVLFIVVPLAIGFGPAGPVLGSIAAGWQSGIGAVVAGSLFATLQSLTMTGVLAGIGAGMIGAGATWKVVRDVDWGAILSGDSVVRLGLAGAEKSLASMEAMRRARRF